MEERIRFESDGGFLRAVIIGDIDHHSATGMRDAIDKRLFREKPLSLILDFSLVHFMDSSGIGLVMGRYRNLIKTGAELSIMGAPPQINKMLKLAGIERLAKLESR